MCVIIMELVLVVIVFVGVVVIWIHGSWVLLVKHVNV